MEQTYSLELKDYLQFQAFIIKRTPQRVREKRIAMAFIPALAGLACLALRMPAPWMLLVIALSALIWIPYIHWAYRKAMAARVKMTTGAVGVHTAEITPEMLRIEGPIIESRIRWGKITEIAESPHHILLLFGAAIGYMVPKNAFRDADHAREFLETARAYQNGMLLDVPETQTSWPPQPRRRRD